MVTAKQKAARTRFTKAAKQAKREGKKGKAYAKRVGQILKGKGGKGGKKSSKGSRKSTRKKTTSKKKKSYVRGHVRKHNPGGGNTNKKMTLGKLHQYHALAGSGLGHLIEGAESGTWDLQARGALRTYTGYDIDTNEFMWGDLWRGYGGIGNETLWRKGAKAMGFKPYPQGSPFKSVSTFLDYVTMYMAPGFRAYQNKDSPSEAHRQIYQSLYGVDLASVGFDSYKPASMMETKLPYTIKKMIFKFLRDAGIKI